MTEYIDILDEIDHLRRLVREYGPFTVDESDNRISRSVQYHYDAFDEPIRFDDPDNDITPEMAGVIRRALRSGGSDD